MRTRWDACGCVARCNQHANELMRLRYEYGVRLYAGDLHVPGRRCQRGLMG